MEGEHRCGTPTRLELKASVGWNDVRGSAMGIDEVNTLVITFKTTRQGCLLTCRPALFGMPSGTWGFEAEVTVLLWF